MLTVIAVQIYIHACTHTHIYISLNGYNDSDFWVAATVHSIY